MAIASAVTLGSTTAYASQITSPGPAAGAELTTGRSWNFTVGKNRDLFSNMKGLMPGDTIENNVVITNNSSQTVSFYFRVRPGDIHEIEAGSEDAAAIEGKNYQSDLLDIISMEIWREDNLLYRGSASGSQNPGDRGEVITLGSVESGKALNLHIEVKLPGEEMTNEFASSFSKIDWQFIAEGTDGGNNGDNGSTGGNDNTGGSPGGNTPGPNGGPGNNGSTSQNGTDGNGAPDNDAADNDTADNGAPDNQLPAAGNQPALTDTAAGAAPAAYQGGGILAENVPTEELFPEGTIIDNPEDMQIIVEDEDVPLAAFSDLAEPGILMNYLDVFLLVLSLGFMFFYLLPLVKRRQYKKY